MLRRIREKSFRALAAGIVLEADVRSGQALAADGTAGACPPTGFARIARGCSADVRREKTLRASGAVEACTSWLVGARVTREAKRRSRHVLAKPGGASPTSRQIVRSDYSRKASSGTSQARVQRCLACLDTVPPGLAIPTLRVFRRALDVAPQPGRAARAVTKFCQGFSVRVHAGAAICAAFGFRGRCDLDAGAELSAAARLANAGPRRVRIVSDWASFANGDIALRRVFSCGAVHATAVVVWCLFPFHAARVTARAGDFPRRERRLARVAHVCVALVGVVGQVWTELAVGERVVVLGSACLGECSTRWADHAGRASSGVVREAAGRANGAHGFLLRGDNRAVLSERTRRAADRARGRGKCSRSAFGTVCSGTQFVGKGALWANDARCGSVRGFG